MGNDIYEFLNEKIIDDITLKEKLESIIIGKNYSEFKLRTRSKVIKTDVCHALGYDVPKSFKKTKPKFPCQNLDIYCQQSNNLQIWNQDIDSCRRYAIIHLNSLGIADAIKIINGKDLAKFDKTGTLTFKYQAKMPTINNDTIFCSSDSPHLDINKLREDIEEIIKLSNTNPLETPKNKKILKIDEIYEKLETLINQKISGFNPTQERSRADAFHKKVCEALGYKQYADNGQFPDIPNQLIEVKLQTSATIDLGLHKPDSDEELDYIIGNKKIKCSDVRYVIGESTENNGIITINHIFVVSGYHFFNFFKLFGGKTQNSKIQIVLPEDFYE